ncbi:MAG: diphosphomevalonate decarboxylase [Chloroflexi bacterium]|nr:MAG: diphosphomevalonate decarboxylase [Chloroflexota bacterium]
MTQLAQPDLWAKAAQQQCATALAHPNIAFIKYWGNTNHQLRLPANPSLSMNMAGLHTVTRVEFDPALPADTLEINGVPATGPGLERVSAVLNLIRAEAGVAAPARVVSRSNFPVGSGIASSAAAFAALAVAGAAAAGLPPVEARLSRLARRGSGSASRSVPSGFCEWQPGDDDGSVAFSIAPPEHWALADLVAVVSREHKAVGSSGGHPLADTSSLQTARVAGAAERLRRCKEALLARDISAMGPVIEEDAVIMHGVMMSSRPPLFYWLPATMALIQATARWRAEGLEVYFTIDAGPNVHLICPAEQAADVEAKARKIAGVRDVLKSAPGGPAHLLAPGDEFLHP